MNFDPNYLIASMFVSSIGFALFAYGKKMHRMPHAVVGVIMLLYPYAVSSVPKMFGIGVALIALLVAATKLLGM